MRMSTKCLIRRHLVLNYLHSRHFLLVLLLPLRHAQHKLVHYRHTKQEFDDPTIIGERYTNLEYWL